MTAPGYHTGFTLSASGQSLVLYNPSNSSGTIKDTVTFGPQLTDLSVGRMADGTGSWQLTAPTPGGINQTAPTAAPGSIKVNEWMAAPLSGEDWFELYNPASQPVALAGLYLTDSLSKPTQSPIPPLTFIGAGAFLEFSADQATNNGALHANFKLSAGGESIAVLTSSGAVIDSVDFGGQTDGVSQGRLPDGGNNIVSFTTSPTPGSANYLPLTNIVINEILTHTDLPYEDAIEFFNPSTTSVDIGGWYLSNSEKNFKKYRMPNGIIIPPGGFYVIYETDFDPSHGSGDSFTFNSAHGDEVHLSAADAQGNLTGYRASEKFDAAENAVSFGRFKTSIGVQFVAMSEHTFGEDDPVSLVDFHKGTGATNAYAKVGPIAITEIMYHPPETVVGTNTVDNSLDEFIELRNITSQTVTLYDPLNPGNTWYVDGDVQYTFPQSVSLAPSEILLLVNFDPNGDSAQTAAFPAKYALPAGTQMFGPYKGKLPNSTGTVKLYKPDPPQIPPHPDAGFVPYILVEQIKYADTTPWPPAADGSGASLQRINESAFGNDPVNWKAAAPTAGRSDAGNTTLAIASVRVQAGQVAIEFHPASGQAYALEFRDSLSGGASWQRLKDIPASSGSANVVVTDSIAAGSPSRFYRISLSAQ